MPGDIIRIIPALWIGALALKLLIWLLLPDQIALDRAVNFALIVLACASIYRLTRIARSGMLWRVSRKLILSYILVGAVPILLLITFSLLALLLIFFDVSSYLVQSRVADLTNQASTLARTTSFEIEQAPEARDRVIATRQRAMQTGLRGVSIVVQSASDLPAWLKGKPFSGLVMSERRLVARAVEPPHRTVRPFAVVVDLPVEPYLSVTWMEDSGISLGERRRESLLNTATFLTYTDWRTGETSRSALPMSVDVATLYRFLGRSQQGTALSFNQLLLYALVCIGILLFLIEMIALGNGLALARSITAAVDDLFGGTVRVKNGNFGEPIAVRSNDQLGQLAASFNDMTSRIRVLLREQDEKRRLAEELRIAREIQMSLLPQGPFDFPGLSIAGMCTPAREVGGDYYDLLPLSGGRVGVLIADVAGKGTSAALYMAELKGLMLSLSRIHSSPRALLIEANRIVSRHLDSRSFITMTYAIADPIAGMMTCSRAGHCPFIRIPAGSNGHRAAEILAPGGMVLGLNLDDGSRFERALEEVSIPLQQGDVLFFFTDGVSEAMDSRGDCFGELRASSVLERYADKAPEMMREQLLAELSAFMQGEPPHDDLTMIILKVGDRRAGTPNG